MRPMVLSVMICGLVLSASGTALGQQREDAEHDPVLADLTAQLKQMRAELAELRQENQELQELVAQQAQRPNTRMMPGGSQTPPQLFEDEGHIQIYQRPGVAPPSWLDLLIEQNRQRTLEAMMLARAKERLADERLAKIHAESRAVGATYAPRPLREAAMAGGDLKAFRDDYVQSRSTDFDALFNQTSVKEYFKTKAARLSGYLASDDAGHGATAVGGHSVHTHLLANQLRQDLEDAKILYGSQGLHGPAPAALGMADELTRRKRHSTNPRVSGPTRDTLELGRRSAAVDVAVANDMDIELVTRMNQIREARRLMHTGRYVPSAAQINEDLAQVNGVLSGKVSRTQIPEVRAFRGFDARRD